MNFEKVMSKKWLFPAILVALIIMSLVVKHPSDESILISVFFAITFIIYVVLLIAQFIGWGVEKTLAKIDKKIISTKKKRK